ncbi:MAG: deoxyribonuclease IV [Ignavibacteriaceae bacterium]|jgi:deoxyribonuclease-4|nr:deoxyribonuclease IV [Ignavibacteriaceae bacterium]
MKKIKGKNQLLGAHTSIQGGVAKAVELASGLGFSAMQIFTKNNNQWQGKPLTNEEALTFKTKLSASGIKFVLSHDSYLINLCAPDKVILEKSGAAFIDEIERCSLLGIRYLNFHPGSHGGAGMDTGIKLIAESLNLAHEKTKGADVFSTLETTAGQGNSIGFRFEQLRQIIDLVEEKERMKVCIDTAHIFAAGYELREKKAFDNVIKEFNDIIGLERLIAFHVNDSKKELGSRVDRHDHIGKGFIGLEGFRNLMNHPDLINIPKILETPKGKEQLEDLENLSLLRSLINQ